MPAPVALFVYNRLEHTKCTINALCNNELADKSEIFIFSDGPREERDIEKVKRVREYIKSLKYFKKINVIEQKENLGLTKSITQGVKQVVDEFGDIIVLEDDILTSAFFLRNINNALELFRDEEQIISISGYTFPHKIKLPEIFFLFFPTVWGWATWKRGWDLYEENGQKLLISLGEQNLFDQMNHNNSYPYKRMLEDEVKGIVDSWGIKWYASSILYRKHTLMFSESLVKNIGHDNTGMHSSSTNVHNVELSNREFELQLRSVVENDTAEQQLIEYLHSVLFDSHLKLTDVCFERLNLINSLTKTANERLELIQTLVKTADERLKIIELLNKELKTLKKTVNQ